MCTGLKLILDRTPTNLLHAKAPVFIIGKRAFSKVIEYKLVAQKKTFLNGDLVCSLHVVFDHWRLRDTYSGQK